MPSHKGGGVAEHERRHDDGEGGRVSWRDYVDTQAEKLREVTETARAAMEHRIVGLEADSRELLDSKATLEGKASQRDVTVVLIIAVAGIIVSMVSALIGIAGLALALRK